jgi:hypothetical protein
VPDQGGDAKNRISTNRIAAAPPVRKRDLQL